MNWCEEVIRQFVEETIHNYHHTWGLFPPSLHMGIWFRVSFLPHVASIIILKTT